MPLVIYMLSTWKQAISQAKTVNEALKLRDQFLRSDVFITLKKDILSASSEEKQIIGKKLNLLRSELQNIVDAHIQQIQATQLQDNFVQFDPSLTITNQQGLSKKQEGYLHPVSQTIIKILDIFQTMGFDCYDGAHLITQWENFDSVNVPEFHPARDLQDTFFLDHKDSTGRYHVMRTQATSNFATYAANHKPPFRTLFPSITFRNETIDATHEVNFHQFDMWMVDKSIAISDLVGLMQHFFQQFCGSSDIQVRLRPSFYPFVQPGFDTDIFVPWLKGGVWLEVAGSGLIHKDVLQSNGINPNEWSGMAWGFGIDRLFMIEHNINSVSQLYEGNLDFLHPQIVHT